MLSRTAYHACLGCCLLLTIASQASSQQADAAPTTPTTAPADAQASTFKQEELDQVLAPVALYPDSLLSQVLMAATYPVEIVQADRWTSQNKKLKGDALTTALEKQTWDASVKSLVNFPQVLTMMSEQLDWTVKLGDAFIAQQKEVMTTVQTLRAKAQSEGNLKSTEQQNVTVEQQEGGTQTIVIEPADPQVIYVPTYNPTVVYGSWSYPSYPPYYYYPPGYVAGASALSFGVGLAVGAAWGYAWGGCDWGNNDVEIDIDRNTNINNNIDRSRYKSEIESRNSNVRDGAGTWQHDSSHRKGASYRDSATAQRFNAGGVSDNAAAARARDSYRGRADAGQQDLARDRSSGSSNRDRSSYSGSHSNAFDGVDRGGNSARNYSQRGTSSRSSSAYSSSRGGSRGGGYSGGGRSGGGGRGGGGRGGGGRGR